MKSLIKKIGISISLSLIFSCFVLVLNANNYNPETKLASLEIPESFQEYQKLEEWMFNVNFYAIKIEQEYEIESWMLNNDFWKIFKSNCSGIQSNFIEKEWMNKHCFFIL
jgi:hypothetical protein